MILQSPFPYFGGKSRIAKTVWQRFGNVRNYVEPFCGSAAVLLMRPHEIVNQVETINDKHGFVANFWRSVVHDAETVAKYCDWPVNENDLHARHAWLVNRKDSLQESLEGDPEFYDAKIAGWWCWGLCCWIGGEFCKGDGPWHVVDGKLVNAGSNVGGIHQQRIHLGDKGKGVPRRLIHLGDKGMGVHRQLINLGDRGKGVHKQTAGDLYEWFAALQSRLRRVRVCCGEWSRVMGPSVTENKTHGFPTGVFLDPPYSVTDREDCYTEEDRNIAKDVARWAIEKGEDRRFRIALCGYEGEHDMPPGWEVVEWKAKGGYGNQAQSRGRENTHRERVWFSPHCVGKRKTGKQMAFDWM